MEDEVLGKIERKIDSWLGEIRCSYDGSGTKTLRFCIRAGFNGPTVEQKNLFEELTRRYESLWPDILSKLVELRPTLRSVEGVSNLLKPRVLLSIPGLVGKDKFDFTLGYEFEDENDKNTGYFISFNSWEIKSAHKAI